MLTLGEQKTHFAANDGCLRDGVLIMLALNVDLTTIAS